MNVEHQDAVDVFTRMMRESHLLPPYELPGYLERHAAELGFDDAMLYLTDLQQRLLVPCLPPGGPDLGAHPSVLGVDSTLAGRAFQHLEPLSHDDGTGRLRVWLPVLDGTERLGVLSVSVRDAEVLDPHTPAGRRLRFLVALLAELVTTKSAYGDMLVRARRTAPMGLAAEIQWALLPPLSFASREVSIVAALEPAYEVAGDSVDYAVDLDIARFALFDGMGHELLSAQLVALVIAAYRNARRAGSTLLETCHHIEEAVTSIFKGDAFVTGLLAELDTATGVFTWVSAGHPQPVLLRHGRRVKSLLAEPRLPFGMALDEPERDGSAAVAVEVQVGIEQLEPGDNLLLYTDGMVEARSPDGELFGVDRLTDLVLKNLAAGLPSSETMRRAVNALLNHQRGDLSDDATLLLAQWRPEDPERQLP